MQLTVVYPTISERLKKLVEEGAGCVIENCDKSFEHYSFSELKLSPMAMANFIDAVNEEYSLKLSKQDFLAIRTVSALVKTIESLVGRH